MRSVEADCRGFKAVFAAIRRHGCCCSERAGVDPKMSSASKRTEGAAEKLGGKIKGGIGRLVGNERMQVEGAVNEAKGRAKHEAAKASSAARARSKRRPAPSRIASAPCSATERCRSQAK